MISFNAEHNVWVLWQDTDVDVVVPVKTLWRSTYGGWVVVTQHLQVNAPYHNFRLFAKMCVIAAVVQKGFRALGVSASCEYSIQCELGISNK